MKTRSHFTFIAFALVGRRAVTTTTCTTKMSSYAKLQSKLREIESLNGIRGLLHWDEMVIMQSGSSDARNAQNSVLAGIIHEKQTSKELGNLIKELTESNLSALESDYDRANVRDAARDYRIESGKTAEQAMKEAELNGRGYQTWVEARSSNDFSKFEPVLREIVVLKKEIAKNTHPGLSLYDANVDLFERGMKSERLDSILQAAKGKLIPLIRAVCDSSNSKNYQVPTPLLGGDDWSVEKQAKLCKEVSEAIGYDFNKGRLDVSVHPFTGGSHPTDTRITTRYSSTNWLEGISGTVHEVGHALYEQGRNPKHTDLPVSRALSMGVHESQSLFWERMIFQSHEFWTYFTPLVHKHFPHTSSVTVDEFYAYVNQVSPGFIRVEADELTYPLHIVLRFEIERGLFDNTIDINAIPHIWNEKMKESLNLSVEKDSQGCLQDIHWSGGAFGYFPSYTLGAMIAAQLFQTVEKEIPDVKTLISTGQFKPIREWLRTHIHEVGSLYETPDELLTAVTGKPLDPSIYIDYLTKKYTTLYKL